MPLKNMGSIMRIYCVVMTSVLVMPLVNADEEKPERIVATSVDQADEDFRFQGEYAGLILTDNPGQRDVYHRVGLQVVALGNGQFDAVKFDYGLPGAGWNGGERARLSGQRTGSSLQLDSDSVAAVIENGHAVLTSVRGNTLGSFPRVVRTSPTMGKCPPHNAVVLFDGTSADEFHNGRITEDGLLMEGADLKRTFTDFTMHLEFRLPYMPTSRGQKRANSGVYLQSRYEVQILDSFGLDGAFNECGALYRYQPPRLNMCLPPLQWQTYDITLISPRFDQDNNKTANARLTVLHNGVAVHNNFEVERKTGAGRPESADPYPIRLQNHSDPVRFRNLWIVEHSTSLAPACPCPKIAAR